VAPGTERPRRCRPGLRWYRAPRRGKAVRAERERDTGWAAIELSTPGPLCRSRRRRRARPLPRT